MLDKKFFEKNYYAKKSSFKKMSQSTGYSVGSLHRAFKKLKLKPVKHATWNSGKTCYEDERILSGEKHPRWKDKSKYYIEYREKRNEIINRGVGCEICGGVAQLLHHKDKRTENNSTNNLQPLCRSCHSTLHNRERGITTRKFKCLYCEKNFIVLHNKNAKRIFCSLSCSASHKYHEGKSLIKNSPRLNS